MSPSRCYALIGSGEFEPWSEEVDRFVLDRAREGVVLILPTASAPEGDEVFDGWATRGLEHFGGLGIPSQVLPLKTREDALRDGLVARLADASMVYISGGNPAHLARTLIGTPFWSALREELDRGLAYVGCSAGVACLGQIAPDSTATRLDAITWTEGLGLFPSVIFGPHWDMLDTYVPGLQRWFLGLVPDDCWMVGIDENTAMVGDGERWRVMGAGSVLIHHDAGPDRTHPSGGSFTFAPPAREGATALRWSAPEIVVAPEEPVAQEPGDLPSAAEPDVRREHQVHD